jgi:hypothetical protein
MLWNPEIQTQFGQTEWLEMLADIRNAAILEERARCGHELYETTARNLNVAILFIAAAKQMLSEGEPTDLLDAAEESVRACGDAAMQLLEDISRPSR